MHPIIRTKFKEILAKIIPDSSILRYLSYLPKIETWRNDHAEHYMICNDRYEIYDYLNTCVIENRPIVYLEFGVYTGKSIKYWSNINSNNESRFFGFDTFTGLPETWELFTEKFKKGHFDLKGQIPNIDDNRVSLIQGLFQQTLPGFLERGDIKSQLVIHNDCDLYSSTLYVLTHCHSIIIPGTIIIFDEFSSIMNEFRALEDYCSAYMREYKVLAATKSSTNYYTAVALQIK